MCWTALAAFPDEVNVRVAALVVRQIAKRKIGGQTGDVLGATQQVTEIALLTGCQMMAYGWQAIP